jgi:GTPase SAR1 family protein
LFGCATRNTTRAAAGLSADIHFDLRTGGRPDVVWFELLHTAGQEPYQYPTPTYVRDAHVVLVTYDTANCESFDRLGEWFDCIKLAAGSSCQYIIIGAKADLEDDQKVGEADAEQLQKSFGAVARIPVAAKENWGIDILVKAIKDAIAQAIAADDPTDVTSFSDPPNPKKRFRC